MGFYIEDHSSTVHLYIQLTSNPIYKKHKPLYLVEEVVAKLQTGRETKNKNKNTQKDKQTNKQANRQTDKQTDKRTKYKQLKNIKITYLERRRNSAVIFGFTLRLTRT